MTQDPAVRLFKQNWTTYQKLIVHNYMFHQEWNEQTDLVIHQLGDNIDLDVLDLGCGDASWMNALKHKEKIKSYTGIDMSTAALAYALTNLTPLNIELKLVEGKMEDLIPEEERSYHLIYSSFAIHHLQDEIKQTLMLEVEKHLKDDGVFILIDVFRKRNQSRKEYLSSYFSLIDDRWTGLSETESSLIVDHIRQYDYPARLNDVFFWMKNLGFEVFEIKVLDEYHKMLVMRKQA